MKRNYTAVFLTKSEYASGADPVATPQYATPSFALAKQKVKTVLATNVATYGEVHSHQGVIFRLQNPSGT